MANRCLVAQFVAHSPVRQCYISANEVSGGSFESPARREVQQAMAAAGDKAMSDPGVKAAMEAAVKEQGSALAAELQAKGPEMALVPAGARNVRVTNTQQGLRCSRESRGGGGKFAPARLHKGSRPSLRGSLLSVLPPNAP